MGRWDGGKRKGWGRFLKVGYFCLFINQNFLTYVWGEFWVCIDRISYGTKKIYQKILPTNRTMSSARVSLVDEDEDSRLRATKKVKDKEEVSKEKYAEIVMGDTSLEINKVSFREALLKVPGITGEGGSTFDNGVEDEELIKNRWYKDLEELSKISFEKDSAIPIIHVSDDEMKDWCEPWKLTLVVNVMGKKLNYRVLENKINRDWARNGAVKIIDLPRGYYAVMFEAEEDYNSALYKGPWMVADHYLLVQRWKPNFLQNSVAKRKVAVWVRVPGLPLELYNDKFLGRLGLGLGSYLKMDRNTSAQARGHFARFCVELDLAKPLVPHVIVRGVKLNLEYEGLHSVCFSCGIYGHRMENCPEKRVRTVTPVNNDGGPAKSIQSEVEKEGRPKIEGKSFECPSSRSVAVNFKSKECINDNPPREEQNEAFGTQNEYSPWMLSKRPQRKRSSGSVSVKRSKAGGRVQVGRSDFTGSRFEVLEIDVEKTDGGFVEVVSSLGEGEVVCEGPGVVPMETNSASGPKHVSKVRNYTGGKNPQLGPRVRDAKKMARSNGVSKKSFLVPAGSGPIEGKENLQPNAKVTVKGNLSKGDVMSIAKDKMERDKAEFIQGLKDMASRQSEGGNKSDSSEKIISSCSKTEP